MRINKELFGKNKFGEIYKYEVEGESIHVTLCEMGASVISVKVLNKDGKMTDVVLGCNGIEGYRHNWPAFGSVVGRYANRISKAKFKLNGQKFKLEKNTFGGCLHSGYGYHLRKWESESQLDNEAHIHFYMDSPTGDQGFPGNLKVDVEYIIAETYLEINYHYTSDEDTVVNLTNHSYFNLNGHNSGTVMNHSLWINGDAVTQLNKKMMPTGKILEVNDSAFDFRQKKIIGDNFNKSFKPYCKMKEYDINYVLNKGEEDFRQVAELTGEKSGITMRVYTDMPGMQFYTANALNGHSGKDGVKYCKYPGACFETQYFPDAVNVKNFETPLAKKGVEYHKKTRYEFIK